MASTATNQVVSMKQLLESGVHFGHQTRRWNPKMKRFIFTERNGIYIIDLRQTLDYIDRAFEYVRATVAEGGSILFVGTKRQAQDVISEEALRCGMYFINQRWLGGLLTNFATIQRSLGRLRDIEAMATDGRYDTLSKKEIARNEKEKRKLQKNLEGIRTMGRLPDAVFIVDTRKEKIAVDEARKLKIPIIGIVDTNCDPDEVDYVIPGNDDALRSIRLFASRVADTVNAGRGLRESAQAEAHEGGDGEEREGRRGFGDAGEGGGEIGGERVVSQLRPAGMGNSPPATNVAVSPEIAVMFGSARVRITPARSIARSLAVMPEFDTVRSLLFRAWPVAVKGLLLAKSMTVAPKLTLALRSIPSCLIKSRCTSATVTFSSTWSRPRTAMLLTTLALSPASRPAMSPACWASAGLLALPLSRMPSPTPSIWMSLLGKACRSAARTPLRSRVTAIS